MTRSGWPTMRHIERASDDRIMEWWWALPMALEPWQVKLIKEIQSRVLVIREKRRRCGKDR